MRVYISGPMRGYPRWNFSAFDRAAAIWEQAGHTPISPAEVDRAIGFDPDGPAEQVSDAFVRNAFARDACLIIYTCDAIALLPGWADSSGVSWELTLSLALGHPVFDAFTRQPMSIDVSLTNREHATP